MRGNTRTVGSWPVLLGSLLLVAACGAGGSDPGNSASARGGSPPAATATTVSPTLIPAQPAVFGPATLVNGQMTCQLIKGPVTADENGTHGRDNSADCIHRMNDPRVTGKDTSTWMVDRWTNAQDETVLIQWGTTTLKTEGGSWEGTYSGAWNGDQDTIAYWYRGKGAYEGLTYHVWIKPKPEDSTLEGWLLEGIIYPGEPPQLP